ncbi:hypothetical protein KFE25_012619 [Diacronema lutheri]|uniref:Uncharacterized protein n=1 Tax=Diacronema lutheri TaxID=2081491 RepID=A0A8J5XHC6_DIALT|nr:hypothetical protein KFE25_012619 [Diacronema lutheri]
MAEEEGRRSSERPWWVAELGLASEDGWPLLCEDTYGVWVPANVVAHDEQRRTIKVHYKGWAKRWEEHLPIRSSRIKTVVAPRSCALFPEVELPRDTPSLWVTVRLHPFPPFVPLTRSRKRSAQHIDAGPASPPALTVSARDRRLRRVSPPSTVAPGSPAGAAAGGAAAALLGTGALACAELSQSRSDPSPTDRIAQRTRAATAAEPRERAAAVTAAGTVTAAAAPAAAGAPVTLGASSPFRLTSAASRQLRTQADARRARPVAATAAPLAERPPQLRSASAGGRSVGFVSPRTLHAHHAAAVGGGCAGTSPAPHVASAHRAGRGTCAATSDEGTPPHVTCAQAAAAALAGGGPAPSAAAERLRTERLRTDGGRPSGGAARPDVRGTPCAEALGDETLGDEATGDEALGDEATGDEATGDEATGDEATGDEATGDEATGDEALGDETLRAEATGDEATGDEALGDEALGDEALGDEALGDETLGDEALGDEATGDEATGDEATRDEATRDEVPREPMLVSCTPPTSGSCGPGAPWAWAKELTPSHITHAAGLISALPSTDGAQRSPAPAQPPPCESEGEAQESHRQRSAGDALCAPADAAADALDDWPSADPLSAERFHALFFAHSYPSIAFKVPLEQLLASCLHGVRTVDEADAQAKGDGPLA